MPQSKCPKLKRRNVCWKTSIQDAGGCFCIFLTKLFHMVCQLIPLKQMAWKHMKHMLRHRTVRNTLKVQSSLVKPDHYLHIVHYMMANPKASGSLLAPRSRHSTTNTGFVLLICTPEKTQIATKI